MSLSTQLTTLLGATVASDVLAIVNKTDPMKRYFATERGKAARKKANYNYDVSNGKQLRLQKDTKEDVQLFLNRWMQAYIVECTKHCKTNAEDEHVISVNPVRCATSTELWKAFISKTNSNATRIRFVSLLPVFEMTPWLIRNGKKVYTAAHMLPLKDFYTPCEE